MEAIRFNLDYIPHPFGLINMGATCYFNALIQGLITCTSLTEICLKNRNNIKFITNPVMKVYISIIDLYHDGNIIIDNLNRSKLASKSPELWQSMINYLKKTDRHSQFGHGQEDSCEGFVMLMLCWENIDKVSALFEHIYHANYICLECKKSKFTFNYMKDVKYKEIVDKRNKELLNITKGEQNLKFVDNKDEGWVESSTHFIVASNLINKEAEKAYGCKESATLQKYILCPKVMHEGITCHYTKCKSNKDKLKYSSLVMLPEILVIVIIKYTFNKKILRSFKSRVTTDLPNKLIFEARSGKQLTYRPIAQIMHSGGMNTGHYWTHAIRSISLSDKETTEYEYKWFNLNDGSVSSVQKFISDNNSYTILYHLMP